MSKDEIALSRRTKQEINRLKLKLDQVTRTKSVLNAEQIQKIFNSTPNRYTYKRPAKGGGNWTYVRASYIRRALDGIFGFNWDFDIETSVQEAFEIAKNTGVCVVKGTLTARTKNDGEWHTLKKTQFGRKEVAFKKETKEPLDFGNDLKAAASDAFKKCAAAGLGIAADVYDPEEWIEVQIVEAQPDEQEENVKRMIEENKKSLREAVKVEE